MVYNPVTDFIGLWRNNGTNVSKAEMPGLDFVIAALGRAGIITVTVAGTAPTSNQSTTAWLQTTGPTYAAEGVFNLWNAITSAYAPATPALFFDFLEACANQSGIAWWTSTGGPPANTVGNNGDLAIRLDQPGGIFGPKVAGAWPTVPLPGTTTAFISDDLDNAFGAQDGNMLYRGAAAWQALTIGIANTLMVSSGTAPFWQSLSTLLDAYFGGTKGTIIYRDTSTWQPLPPGVPGQTLFTRGSAAPPIWQVPEFPSGTVMLFGQTAAPTGWTKSTVANDCALRVTTGTVGGNLAGTPFTTVIAQTTVGGHALDITEIAPHTHTSTLDGDTPIKTGASGSGITAAGVSQQALQDVPFSINSAGGSGGVALPHTHSINLNFNYVDVIVATKN